jgi:hypothetical protein
MDHLNPYVNSVLHFNIFLSIGTIISKQKLD